MLKHTLWNILYPESNPAGFSELQDSLSKVGRVMTEMTDVSRNTRRTTFWEMCSIDLENFNKYKWDYLNILPYFSSFKPSTRIIFTGSAYPDWLKERWCQNDVTVNMRSTHVAIYHEESTQPSVKRVDLQNQDFSFIWHWQSNAPQVCVLLTNRASMTQ